MPQWQKDLTGLRAVMVLQTGAVLGTPPVRIAIPKQAF